MTDMSQSSGSDSGDSDRGVRYKTVSTRNFKDRENEETNESKSFGPVLPPHLQINNTKVGPELPPQLKTDNIQRKNKIIGPELPPNFKSITDKLEEHPNMKPIGPALPPHIQKGVKEATSNLQLTLYENEISNVKMVGPALPPHFISCNNRNVSKSSDDSIQNTCTSPVLSNNNHQPLQFTEELDEDVYGPLPVGYNQSKAHVELEERALKMKIDMLNPAKASEPIREEWMLELPAAKAANLGLGPRQFRAKEAPDLSDRSSWTDTPEDRAKKKEKNKEDVDIRKIAELKELNRRDKQQEEIARKCKRPEESLVDMHRKKMKKKKEDAPGERRPFSREVDLQVNRFDEAQKKAVLKKAQLLDNRFSAGHSKFL
ncbi:GPALPP motifs-containing protein 1 [Diorhabda carinulata]|uniref:GPALPP motifs-containing protein 1 n=1 Tax=Diorhabda carinulata TaxID=1163345 RepID=UPI0025A2EB7A|nr:GPALPP motifs-containing protein 1 [Diorhabda carinulata]